MSDVTRAKLSQEVESMKPVVEQVHSELKSGSKPEWYVSVVYERRQSTTAQANTMKVALDEDLNEGIVMRVYDGLTMFEEACDDLDLSSLKQKAKALTERAKANGIQSEAPRFYQSPSWAERLKVDLDSEITSQIPSGANADSWVHFGTRWEKGYWTKDSEMLDAAKGFFKTLKEKDESLPEDNAGKGAQMHTGVISAAMIQFLFMDDAVKMSQTLTRDRAVALAVKNGQRGIVIKGGLGGLETTELFDHDYDEVFENLQMVLDSEPLKPGRYKVLMHPAISGVFAHEAFGHTQEGDTWARGRSKAKMLYEKKIPVGNKNSNIINNPAAFKNGNDSFASWGSYFFDEEGWLASKNYLVKDGILQAPMTNLTSSLRLGVPRTANGKRESWTNGMYTRQTNTYFEEGDLSFNELISKVDYGFLATFPYGGMEDPKGMGIQVGIQFLQEIKDGKLTGKTFKGPAGGSIQMTGYVPDYLNSIVGKTKIDAFEKYGDDNPEHPWNEAGGCGKYHKESVVAGCGGPYMLVENVLLG